MASEASRPKIRSREQLACVLRQASQLEHLLACQYLFAAFSMRKSLSDFPEGGDEKAKQLVMARNQRWEFKVMQIARQEMEHLGIVNNLIGALGEEPYFDRPNFPLPRTYLPIDAPFVLEKFGRPTLERFLAYERPDYLEVPEAWRGGGPQGGCVVADDCGVSFADVQQLYEDILDAFHRLPAGRIFRGDTQRQVDNQDAPAFGLGVTMMPVTNRDDATTAIGLILEQGEGIGDYPLSPDSHFQSFNQILQDLLAASGESAYDPALPVVDNPLLESHSSCDGATIITHEYSRQAIRLFNRSYAVMLAFLERFFYTFRGFWGPDSAVTSLIPLDELQLRTRNAALLDAAFFPFMTMVLRPLGDMITRLPAFADDVDGPRAGPSFELEGGRVPELEDFPDALAELAEECRLLEAATVSEERRRDIGYIADNLSRMHQNFTRAWNAVR